jgi:hypothetical protein
LKYRAAQLTAKTLVIEFHIGEAVAVAWHEHTGLFVTIAHQFTDESAGGAALWLSFQFGIEDKGKSSLESPQ